VTSVDHHQPTADPDGGSTRLVVPVPELAHLVGGAHIALLDPFLATAEVDEGVVAELREILAEIVPFAFVLGPAVRFPTGAAYLPPQPSGVFRRITHSVRRAFPEVTGHPHSLHGSIPHLSLDEDVVDAVPTPLEVHARKAVLLAGKHEQVSVLATFRFGTSAA
jgi:hypothetical protein